MKRLLICLGLLSGALTLMAQELSIGGGRFRKGDDPAWSAQAYDDTSWQEVSFDGQPWEKLLDYANGYGWYRIHVVIPSSLKKGVVEALRRAKEWVDARPGLHPLITINSWNEWTETSYLQPDNEYGYGYLEAVRNVFAEPSRPSKAAKK